MHPIIAFCGGQGAGKTTHAKYVQQSLNMAYYHASLDPTKGAGVPRKCVVLNIKDTFTGFVNPIIDELSQITPEFKDQPAFKKLQLAISTWGEEVYKDVWSDRYQFLVSKIKDPVVMDDCRTEMNLKMLLRLSATRPVVVFKLTVDEETRRKRVSFWRENGGYTEKELFEPESGTDFQWFEIDTTHSFELSRRQVVEKLERFYP